MYRKSCLPVRQRRDPYQPGATPQGIVDCKGQRAEGPAHAPRAIKDGSGFQPSASDGTGSWGVAPGWYGCGPLALREPGLLARVPVQPLRDCVKSQKSVHERHENHGKKEAPFVSFACFVDRIPPVHRCGALFTQSLRVWPEILSCWHRLARGWHRSCSSSSGARLPGGY